MDGPWPGGWMMFHTARGNLIKTWLLIKAACTARNGRMLVRQRTAGYPLLDYFLPASHFLASIGTSGTCQRLLAARILHAGSKNTARWQQDFCPLAAR